MARDVGERLKRYLQWLLNAKLADEIAYQIEGPWSTYFDQLVNVLIHARNNQQKVFEDAKKAQLDFERRHERAWAVFNFFKGIALSWLAGQLQYRVIGNYLKKKEWSIPDSAWAQTIVAPKVVWQDTKDSKVAGKVFADVGKEVVGWLLSLGASKVLSPPAAKLPDTHDLAYSTTAEDLQHKLRSELRYQKDHAMSVMQDIDNQIAADTEVGDRLLALVYRMYPYAQDDAAEQVGMQLLNEAINKLRNSWADVPGMEFYTHDPPNRADFYLENHMEKEMWVLWYLEWHHVPWDDKEGWDSTAFIKGDLPWYETIISRMNDLNIPTVELMTSTGPSREDAEERFIQWCRAHKPVDPTGDRQGPRRQLASIEQWKRPGDR